ncbi:MAG: molybdopterin-guanine dinucleotide biosynthesis protein B [Cupriavidus sp.]|nr:molybdopterin-guanine dinucleotide biosynthesis protein B [Cupriavidus sp.]
MHPFILGITGTSGSGKTTLITALLPWFRAQGLTVNVVKHSHHPLELEPPGKDSARFRAAGAAEVMVASPYRYAIVRELADEAEPTLAEQVARLRPADITLVEGFRREAIPRIEVYRPAHGRAPCYPGDPSIIALATDTRMDTVLPCMALDDIAQVGGFILAVRDQGAASLPASFDTSQSHVGSVCP